MDVKNDQDLMTLFDRLTLALTLTLTLTLTVACTDRSRREHRMSSDENVKRSQRRRSPMSG